MEMRSSDSVSQYDSVEPLLSICLPVYNGANLVDVVLNALMVQVAPMSGLVEVIVADDGSSDATESVIRGSDHFCSIRYIRNSPNQGMSPNIVRCLREHAKGTFVWIWSQHCVLLGGALDRVISALRRYEGTDGFYVNFNCATFPDDWPQSATEAMSPRYQYRSSEDTSEKRLDRWQELLCPQTGYCTQTYAHILRTELARRYWEGRPVGREFTDARDTYAQSCTVAESMFDRPTVYIGDPVFTIYNGAQTWSSLEQRSRVYLLAFPDLVSIFREHGFRGRDLAIAEAFASAKANDVIREMLTLSGPFNRRRVILFLWRYGTWRGVLKGFLTTFVESDCNLLARLLHAISRMALKVYTYCFRNCRPARWYHRRKGSNLA